MGVAPGSIDSSAAPDDAVSRPLRVEDGVVRLCGRPDRLVGVITIARAPEPAAFKTATMNIAETEVGYRLGLTRAPMRSSSLPVDPAVPVDLHLGAGIAPGTSGRIPVRLSLPRTTPPARYEAVFDIGGEARRAEIEVLADESLAIESRGIVLSGHPGDVVHEKLIFANRGNVPLRLDVLGSIILEDTQPLCVSVQHALEQVRDRDRQEDAHRVFLDALVKRVADRRPNTGRARLADGARTLGPGEVAELTVAFHLPSDMVGGRRYHAMLECVSARLLVQIEAKGRSVPVAEDPAQTSKVEAATSAEAPPPAKLKKARQPRARKERP